FGAYDTYRQTRFAVQCGGAPIPYGNGLDMNFTDCAALPNPMGMDPNLAYDLSRYETLFLQPSGRGGVKTTPDDVILACSDGPESPVQTVLVSNKSGLGKAPNPRYVPCGPMLGGECVMRLQHSCQNNVAPEFFADPGVRLNGLINKAKFKAISSICGKSL